MRKRVAVLVAAPIAVAGSLVAHQINYGMQAPSPTARAWLLANTGHGYLRHLPLVIAACLVTALIGAVLDVTPRALRRGGLAAWPLALVAPLAYATQEHLERFIHDGVFPTHLIGQRAFTMGLLLQIPFALFAWGLARTILRATRRVVEAIRSSGRRLSRRPADRPWRPIFDDQIRRAPIAHRLGGRAPPPLLAL